MPLRKGCSARFEALDSNHDGVVSRAEFMVARHARGQRAEAVVQLCDANGDGMLTREEFCASRDKGKDLMMAATLQAWLGSHRGHGVCQTNRRCSEPIKQK
jgi:hypothetical protein